MHPPITTNTNVTTRVSKINCNETLNFFIPIAVKTPTSYFRSLTLNILRTTNTTPPIANTTIRKYNAISLKFSSGKRLLSY